MQDQMSFNIEELSKELWEQNLIVLREGKYPEYMTYEDLFSGYKKIKAVTFSSSPEFFDDISQNYDEADIILGLSTTDFKNGLIEVRNQKISKKSREQLFANISDYTREKLVDKTLTVSYGNKGTLIHSKFYLLYNDEHTRIIYGSANMSRQAFDERIKQAEIVAYFDDEDELVEHFEKNFNYLKKQTSPYFIKKQIDYYKEFHQVKMLSAEESDEVMYEDIEELSDDMYSAIAKINKNEDISSLSEDTKYVINVMKKSSKKIKDRYVKKDKDDIQSNIHQLKEEVIMTSSDKSAAVEQRSKIMFEDSADGRKIINYQPTDDSRASVISNFDYSREDLEKGIRNLDDWIGTYRISTKYDVGFGKKIMDIILAGFSSVFFKEFRERIYHEETINQITKIPMFIVLAGQAESGKSELLNYMNRLLGNRRNAYAYNKIIGGKNPDVILGGPVTSGNRMPIMIDEANVKHFSDSGNKLSQFIKSVSNDINTAPAIFFTTNTENFSMPTETRRRSHIYMMQNIFVKSEIKADYAAVLERADNTLFKIFCTKMVKHLDDEEIYKKINHATKDIDFLYLTKVIFKEMYDELGLEYPDYLSEELIDDYDSTGRREWKMLFLNNKEVFTSTLYEGEYILTVLSSFFHPNQGVRDSNITFYKEYLPDKCRYEAISNEMHLVIKEKEFFEWLDIEDPFRPVEPEKKKKLFGIFNKD